MKQKSILVVSGCMVVLCVVLLCCVPTFFNGAEKDPVADVNVEEKDPVAEKDPNSIVRLSTLSNEECLEFLSSRDIDIPDVLLEPDRNYDFRWLIAQFEKESCPPIVVYDNILYKFVTEVRQAVIQYYGFDDSLRRSLEVIIQAINDQDSKTIKSLLSEYFIDHCTDVDLKIDEMIAFIDGEIISYDKPFGAECGSFEEKDSSASIHCFMTDQGTEYYIDIQEWYLYDDEHPEQLGIYFIIVKNLSKWSEDPGSKEAIFRLDVTG